MNSADDYDGGRTAGDIVKWAEGKLSESAEPPEVVQVWIAYALSTACIYSCSFIGTSVSFACPLLF